MNELSERLGKAVGFLKRNGYLKSNTELSERIGVQRSTLTMVIKGDRVPTWEMLLDFCDAYPIDLQWLRKGEGEMIRVDREAFLLKRIAELERMLEQLKE